MTANHPERRGLLSRFFSERTPPKEEVTWQDYMEKRRDFRDLVGLAQNQEIEPFFQERTLQILFCPDVKKLPFATNVDTDDDYISISGINIISSLTDNQAQYVAGLIPEYIEKAKKGFSNPDKIYRLKGVIAAYNRAIPQLIDKIPEDDAEELFKLFKIEDPEYAGSHVRYDSLRKLLSSNANEKWKRKATNQIHSIIESEKDNPLSKKENDTALFAYKSILNLLIIGGTPPLSDAFIEDEIKYLLEISPNTPILDQWNVEKVLPKLADPDIRHRFARAQVLSGDDNNSFTIYGDDRAAAARYIMQEFPEDEDLKEYLEQQLTHWETVKKERELQKSIADAREEEIFNRMKIQSST